MLKLLLLGVELGGPLESGAVDASDATLQLFAADTASLPVYQGPWLRPEVAAQRGALWLGVSPAVHLSRDGDVSVRQAALSLRPRYQGDVLLAGVDLGVSGGSARRDGEVIAAAPAAWSASPTVGGRAALGERVYLTGRLCWDVTSVEARLEQGLSAALGLSWRL